MRVNPYSAYFFASGIVPTKGSASALSDIMKQFSPAALTEPAFGATAIRPYTLNALFRWALVVVFLVYAAAGQTQGATPVVISVLVFVVGAMLFAEVQLRQAGNDEGRLLRAWARILPVDIIVIMFAASLDRNEFSPIPTLSVATLVTAAAMFRTRYILGLTAAAAGLALGAHVFHDMGEGQFTFWSQTFSAVVIVGAGGFAAVKGRTEEQLRRQLTTSEERQREQARALRTALESAHISEARFEALSRYAPAIIALYDRDGSLTFASSYLTREFGVRLDQHPGVGLGRGRIPPEDLARVTASVAGAVAGTVASEEFGLRDATGELRRMTAVFFPTEDGAAAIIQDVTAERALATQVQRAAQMETLGTLAGGIAHDFNNLLTAILGNIHLASSELPADSPLRTLLSDAQVAGERGAELVRRLLEYSRPRIDGVEPVNLARLLDETARLAGRGLTPQIELTVGQCDPLATVWGSFGSLQQVLLNLLINARDAMPAGGKLIIAWEPVEIGETDRARHIDARPGTYHAVSVADNGSGIPAAALERIFDPFFTTKDVGKGTGLGLSTALSIMRAHSGWIDVDSCPGEGTTFRLLLPAIAAVEVMAGEPVA